MSIESDGSRRNIERVQPFSRFDVVIIGLLVALLVVSYMQGQSVGRLESEAFRLREENRESGIVISELYAYVIVLRKYMTVHSIETPEPPRRTE